MAEAIQENIGLLIRPSSGTTKTYQTMLDLHIRNVIGHVPVDKLDYRRIAHWAKSMMALADKHTGTTINFVRGQDTSAEVQIDHVVPLSEAWQKDAQQLSDTRRRELANDPLNLMAVDGPTNAAKSDSDAATWLPPNKAFRCGYVARQTSVEAKSVSGSPRPSMIQSLASLRLAISKRMAGPATD